MAATEAGWALRNLPADAQHDLNLQSLKAASDLPEGMPQAVNSPLAWSGLQFKSSTEHVLSLRDDHIAELEQALEGFKSLCICLARLVEQTANLPAGLGLDGTLVCRDNFPLPMLGPQLAGLRHELHAGRGFGSVRGLDPERYSVEDLTILHLGIQVHVADQFGRQDRKGNMLGTSSSLLSQASMLISSSAHRGRQFVAGCSRPSSALYRPYCELPTPYRVEPTDQSRRSIMKRQETL